MARSSAGLVSLDGLETQSPRLAAKVLARLDYEAVFRGHEDGLLYAQIHRLLKLGKTSNPSVFFSRVRVVLSRALPADALVVIAQGRCRGLMLRQPISFQLTRQGQPIDELSLARELALDGESDGAPRKVRRSDDQALFQGINAALRADRRLSAGFYDEAGEAIAQLHRSSLNRTSSRMTLWASLHEMRLLRQSEQWAALATLVRRVRLRGERDTALPPSTVTVLLAACELSECWIEYDRARKLPHGQFLPIASRLEALAAQSKSALNLWVQCDRFNLLSLVYRRAAVDLTHVPWGQRNAWSERSLGHNHDAIELASLGGNQQSLASYMSNRSLLLAELAGAGLTWCKGQRAETWEDAVRWLVVSEDLARGLNGGADSVWSGPYWLTIVRLARPVIRPMALLKVAQQHSPWFRSKGASDAAQAALVFAEPALSQMIDQIGQDAFAHPDRFDRQLTVLCRELGDLAQCDGLNLSRYPGLKGLHRWARQPKPHPGDFGGVEGFLGRFLPVTKNARAGA